MKAAARTRLQPALEVLSLTVVIFLFCRLGVALSMGNSHTVSPLWPASGAALAGLWVLGWSRWPAIVIGTAASNLLSGDPFLFVCLGPWGNAGETLAALWLARRFDLKMPFCKPADVPVFLIFVCALPAVVSGIWSVGVLYIAGVISWLELSSTFFLWWLGNSQGILLVAPAGIAFRTLIRESSWAARGECLGFSLLAALATAAALLLPTGSAMSYPLSWTAFAVVLWAAFRQGFPGAALATCATIAVATGATLFGTGVFLQGELVSSLSLLVVFNVVVAATGLLVAASHFEGRQSQEHLRESEARIRHLHDSMRDAFVSVDMHGRIQQFNSAYTQIVGYQPEELAALTYIDITPEKWHAMEASIVRDQILPHGDSDIYEKEYRRKDGSLVPVELRAFLIRNDDGTPTGIWAIVRDISERKRIEGQAGRALRHEAEWLQLRIQSQPHLLFNALTSLRALIRVDPDQAVEFATKLARFLRASLRIDQRHLVPLETELELATNYLDVERFRFEERLRWRIDVPSELLTVEFPPLVLLTLVENAVKHSIAHRIEGGEIHITSGYRGPHTFLRVENTGSLSAQHTERGGVGLRNARERLELLFGTAAALELRENGSKVVAEVRIPRQLAPSLAGH